MKHKLIDFVKVYDNFLSESECNTALEEINQSCQWQKHSFYTASGDLVEHENELDVSWTLTSELQSIQNKLWFGIERYVLKDFVSDYFNGWSGYTQLRINRYSPSTEMNLHCDHIHTMFDGLRKGIPILSIVGTLNDDYIGGRFVFWEDTEIELPRGSLMIFPSNFLYPHRVEPVTEGVRYSYVSWVW